MVIIILGECCFEQIVAMFPVITLKRKESETAHFMTENTPARL